ncbi:hypothetical protein C0J52_24149 [Blattella germanica]|nr:hypothetical protein C0J52_24149 [Blattella germanica]
MWYTWLAALITSSSSETLPSAGAGHQLHSSVGSGSTLSSVVVPKQPTRVTKIHDTERYRRGTLPPTPHNNSPAGAACAPGPNCSPVAVALLKAARDGDESALKHLLSKAEEDGGGGISEEDLNCQDSSGRVSTVNYSCLPNSTQLTRVTDTPVLLGITLSISHESKESI